MTAAFMELDGPPAWFEELPKPCANAAMLQACPRNVSDPNIQYYRLNHDENVYDRGGRGRHRGAHCGAAAIAVRGVTRVDLQIRRGFPQRRRGGACRLADR